MTAFYCEDTGNIVIGPYHTESVDRLLFAITKDDVIWTGIDSVQLTFKAPDGTEFTRNCTLLDDADGEWYYDTLVTDLTQVGEWSLGIKITDGAIVKYYPYAVQFETTDTP